MTFPHARRTYIIRFDAGFGSSGYSQSASLLAHSVPRSIGHNRIAAIAAYQVELVLHLIQASPLTHRLMLFAFEAGDFLDSVKNGVLDSFSEFHSTPHLILRLIRAIRLIEAKFLLLAHIPGFLNGLHVILCR